MRTRDAITDELHALRLALASGNGTCPTAPYTWERYGWNGRSVQLAALYGPIAWRHWQVGALARRIWESLPRAERYWLEGRR